MKCVPPTCSFSCKSNLFSFARFCLLAVLEVLPGNELNTDSRHAHFHVNHISITSQNELHYFDQEKKWTRNWFIAQIWSSLPLICRCLLSLPRCLPFHRFRVSSTFSLSPSPSPSCPVAVFLDAASCSSIFQHLPNVIKKAAYCRVIRCM